MFEKHTPLSRFGSLVGFSAIGAPASASVQPEVAELLRDLPTQLGLPEVGVVTPWAGRISDLDWREIDRPDTNIASFELTNAKLLEASTALFGAPIPFVTVLTGELQNISVINRILDGSSYELFETQAVYRQVDPDPVPRILFLHWLRVLDLPDIPSNPKSMDEVARDLHGSLLFSQQVPVGSSTIRSAPVVSFDDAFGVQEPAPIQLPGIPTIPVPTLPGNPNVPGVPGFPGPGPIVPGPAPAPPPTQKASLFGPLVVGLGIAAATVAIARAVKK